MSLFVSIDCEPNLIRYNICIRVQYNMITIITFSIRQCFGIGNYRTLGFNRIWVEPLLTRSVVVSSPKVQVLILKTYGGRGLYHEPCFISLGVFYRTDLLPEGRTCFTKLNEVCNSVRELKTYREPLKVL